MGWRAFVGPIVCVASLGVAAGATALDDGRPPVAGEGA